MLKLFRRFREMSLKENKLRRYLLYGVGEILLIIVGVLIALGVAEWSKQRSQQHQEHQALLSIYIDLENKLNLLNPRIERLESVINRLTILDSLLQQGKPPKASSLDTLFGAVWGVHTFSFDRAYYEDLKSSGLDLVKDEAVRKQLIVVYESYYGSSSSIYDMEMQMNTEEIRPYYFKHFKDWHFWKTATPNDLNFVWWDNYYKSMVAYRLLVLNVNQKPGYNGLDTEINKLMRMIEEYIDI